LPRIRENRRTDLGLFTGDARGRQRGDGSLTSGGKSADVRLSGEKKGEKLAFSWKGKLCVVLVEGPPWSKRGIRKGDHITSARERGRKDQEPVLLRPGGIWGIRTSNRSLIYEFSLMGPGGRDTPSSLSFRKVGDTVLSQGSLNGGDDRPAIHGRASFLLVDVCKNCGFITRLLLSGASRHKKSAWARGGGTQSPGRGKGKTSK